MIIYYKIRIKEKFSILLPSTIFAMKVAFYFYLLAVWMIQFVEAKNERLMFFRKHHDKMKIRAMGRKATDVRNKVCSAQTCTKCLNVFATASKITGVTRKMKLSCATILKLRTCCPQKLRKMF